MADSIIGKFVDEVGIVSLPALVHYDITKYLPQSDFGLIIITGRHPAANDLGYPIPIGDLLEEEAMNLLFHRTNRERTHANIEDARMICCHLSCLALAVDQAGAYIKSTGIDLSLFIEHFNDQQENIMAWSPPLKNYKRLDSAAPDHEIAFTVSTTWELSCNRISGSKEIIEAKRHFLLLSAFFTGNCIGESIFRQFFKKNSQRPSWINMFQDHETLKWNSSAFLAVITELRGLSLFQSNSVSSRGVVYSFHPMTRKWALYRQSRIESYLPYHSDHLFLITFVPEQIESCFLNCEKFVSGLQALGTFRHRKIGYIMALFFTLRGKFDESELLFKRIVLSAMRDDQILWLESVCGLSAVLTKSSRFQEVIELLTEALDSLPGPPFGTQCECRLLCFLALVYQETADSVPGESGKLYEACTLLEKVLAINKKEFGKNSLKYRQNLTILASLYSDIPGFMDLAQNSVVETLDLLNKQKMMMGSESQRLGIAHYADKVLVSIICKKKDYDNAEVIQTDIFSRYITELGENNFETMLAKLKLSVIWKFQGRHRNALDSQRELLRQIEQHFGGEYLLETCIGKELCYTLRKIGREVQANEVRKEYHLQTDAPAPD
ncbi:hypothetical protein BCON_0111g00040 [Botryotinia convoluta]|uniref:MalT-like TPR region domain-containing protein n=1 Tax=Botryotinia convoluta TaxID=54673 RepID=A0A4Z1HYK0_9HELO|nr:hypothetical protein BCON_0111g00040 [Botryotinia convoluta]